MKCSTCDETDETKFRWRAERNRYESTCRACNAARMRRYHKQKTEAALTAEKELIEADPYRYTVGKILERAGLDKDMGFINGEWFEYLCDLAGWEPDHIKRRMAKVYGL